MDKAYHNRYATKDDFNRINVGQLGFLKCNTYIYLCNSIKILNFITEDSVIQNKCKMYCGGTPYGSL